MYNERNNSRINPIDDPWDLVTIVMQDPYTKRIIAALAVVGVAWLAVQIVRRVLHKRERDRWQAGSRYVEITAPRAVPEAGGEAFWGHVAAMASPAWRRFWFGQPAVVWELRLERRRLTVRVWVPSCINPGLIVAGVEAAWPSAGTRVVVAETPLPDQPLTTGGRLVWRSDADRPVEPGQAGVDRLRALLHVAGELDADACMVVHVAARPASRRATARLRKSVWSTSHSGTSLPGQGLLREIVSIAIPGMSTTPAAPQRQQPEPAYLAHQRKIRQERLGGGRLWTCSVQWGVSLSRGTPQRLVAVGRSVAESVVGLPGAYGVRRRRVRQPAHVLNQWRPGREVLLNTVEVALLAHLPFDEIVPILERSRARQVRAVEAIPTGGRNVKALGRAARDGRRIGLRAVDARQHVHMVGATGTGKSTLLANMILSDINNRNGVMVIDPKGDLINHLLDRLEPAQVRDRLILFDPALKDGPGFLPLGGDNASISIDHVVGICRNLWERHWGPRADFVLRNGLRTILAAREDLTDLPRLLLERNYWQPALKRIGDNEELNDELKVELKKFWKWWDKLDDHTRQQAMGPIISRFDALFGSRFMRNTIGNPRTTVDVGRALDEGGIVLARLPKGELPESSVPLLGSVMVAKAWQTALARSRLLDEVRPESSLYIDEAHNFLNLPYAVEDMLAEARGLHLGMVLAHQHLGQLSRELAEAISANARNKVFFNVSPEDAHRLARHTLPELTEDDLSRLDAYQAGCRLVVDNVEQPAFTLATDPAAPKVGEADQIRGEAIRRPAFPPRQRDGDQDAVSVQDEWGEAV